MNTDDKDKKSQDSFIIQTNVTRENGTLLPVFMCYHENNNQMMAGINNIIVGFLNTTNNSTSNDTPESINYLFKLFIFLIK